jgi:hypothetical protein
MRKNSVNFKMIVAVIFAAICILALGTSLFAQTGSENPKKERTKTITLKIVEDENGKVTKIDTTFIYEGDDPSSQFFYWNDDKNLQYNLSKLDSMNFKFDFETNSLDSIEQSMFFIQSDIEEEMKGLEEEFGKLREFTFTIQDSLEADGMKRIWVTVDGDSNDSIIEKNIKIIKGGKDQVIVVGEPDTTIKMDGQKIIVTTGFDDETGKQTKTVTVTSEVNAEGGEEKTVTIIVDGEDVDVQNIEDGKKIVIVKTKVNIHEPEDATQEELKSAGIKEKKGNLEVENLKFSPNPSNGKFNLSFSVKEKKKVTINIYNIKGNLVYSETLKDFEGTYNKEIDISDEESGSYFIQIIQGIYDIIKKIIIQ